MSFPRYAKYRASGVDWLGDLPEDWKVKPLKHALSSIVSGGTPEVANESYWALGDEDGHNWVAIADMTRDAQVRRTDRRITEVGRASKDLRIVPRGTLLYSMYASLGKVAVLDVPAAFNQAILALVPSAQAVDQGFLRFWLNSLEERLELFSSSNTQDNLNAAKVRGMPLFLPALPDQRTIADFLDRETTKIDALVAKKRTLIERLKEKRTALISRTVTRGLPPDAARAAGLDPHPKLKPSGIHWLGEVPEHWELKQLKWAVMFQRGHDLPTDEREEGTVPLVSSSGVSATHSRAVAKAPGIVTGRYGTVGQFYLVQEDYWPLNTALYSIDLRGNEPRFLLALLTHLSPLFLLNSVKSAVPGVDRNDIHPIAAVIPGLSEQNAIANFLDRETAKIDAMVAKVETAIERLWEYRTALITAAVTGKIDVRGTSPSVGIDN